MEESKKPSLEERIQMQTLGPKVHLALQAALHLIPDMALLERIVNRSEEEVVVEADALSKALNQDPTIMRSHAIHGRARAAALLELVRVIHRTQLEIDAMSGEKKQKVAAVDDALRALGL